MSTVFRTALALALGVLAASATAVRAQQIKEAPITPLNDVTGVTTYQQYCAVCHGIAGKGDGPAMKALTTPPADLTTLTSRNKGKFPAMAVKMSITGDTVVAAHGTRDMPIWGPILRSIDGHAKTELRLKNLLDYIERLQANSGTRP